MDLNFIALFVAIPIILLTAAFVLALQLFSETDQQSKDLSEAKVKHRAIWVTSIVLAFVYVLTGIPTLTGAAFARELFAEYGYSTTFQSIIGAVEFLCGILLIPPSTTTFAATILSFVMAGSIYTHIAAGEYGLTVIPVACLGGLIFIGYERSRFSKLDNKASP